MSPEIIKSHDLEALRALRAVRHRIVDTADATSELVGLDKIRRAVTLLESIMVADVVANADPALWQVRKDLREGLAEVGP